MFPARALYTLKEAQLVCGNQGSARDDLHDLLAASVSADIEEYLDRRVVFRAPTDGVSIVDSVAIANGALAIANQPNTAGRMLRIVVTDADRGISAGVVTATGTVGGTAGITEVFDLSNGLDQFGVKPFTLLTDISVSGLVGKGTGDTIKVEATAGYVEYHSTDRRPWRYPENTELWPLEWPVQYVSEVNEDSTRAYAAATQLVQGTDFLVAGRERLVRINTDPVAWERAYRAVKHVYSAGYFTAANVPSRIKRVALRLHAMYYEEVDKKQIEMSSVTNALGTFTRFGPAGLTEWMRRDLSPFRRHGYFEGVERDFDLEAA